MGGDPNTPTNLGIEPAWLSACPGAAVQALPSEGGVTVAQRSAISAPDITADHFVTFGDHLFDR
jgi:hypothetical protein